jgi:hypothetical protein
MTPSLRSPCCITQSPQDTHSSNLTLFSEMASSRAQSRRCWSAMPTATLQRGRSHNILSAQLTPYRLPEHLPGTAIGKDGVHETSRVGAAAVVGRSGMPRRRSPSVTTWQVKMAVAAGCQAWPQRQLTLGGNRDQTLKGLSSVCCLALLRVWSGIGEARRLCPSSLLRVDHQHRGSVDTARWLVKVGRACGGIKQVSRRLGASTGRRTEATFIGRTAWESQRMELSSWMPRGESPGKSETLRIWALGRRRCEPRQEGGGTRGPGLRRRWQRLMAWWAHSQAAMAGNVRRCDRGRRRVEVRQDCDAQTGGKLQNCARPLEAPP